MIPITATPGDGAEDADFSGVPASVTFNSGETSKAITFAATDDTADDDDETVALGFGTPPSGVTAGTTSTTTVTITDNDEPPPPPVTQVTVSFGAASYTVTEGSSVSVEVKLNQDPERTVTIPITATPGGGAEAADFSVVPENVTFAAGDTSQTITFAATDDTADDDGETVALGFGTPPSGVSAGTTSTTTVTITDNDDPAITVSFGAASYTVTEGSTVSVGVSLNQDPERTVAIPITATPGDGATAADYSGVPQNVTFDSGETQKSFVFTAETDTDDDHGESVRLSFDSMPDARMSEGSPSEAMVTITDAPRQNPGGNVGASGTVVTITRVPNGTVIPDHSSLWVGETVDDGSTFVEGTRALFRLEFEAVGGGPPVGDGVDLEMSYDWRHDSPLVTTHGQVVRTTLSLLWAEVWDTAVQIHDNDVGHPDGTVTIRITGCTRSGCIIGTPSELTLTIADDDGGPVAAVPGPPGVPRLVCAPSGDGYDNTGIAASWKAPAFVGGAPVESYELRYRESSRFVGGTLIEHPWESWPHGVAATSATLTGLVTGAEVHGAGACCQRHRPGPVVRAVVLPGGPDSRNLRNHRPVDPVGARRVREPRRRSRHALGACRPAGATLWVLWTSGIPEFVLFVLGRSLPHFWCTRQGMHCSGRYSLPGPRTIRHATSDRSGLRSRRPSGRVGPPDWTKSRTFVLVLQVGAPGKPPGCGLSGADHPCQRYGAISHGARNLLSGGWGQGSRDPAPEREAGGNETTPGMESGSIEWPRPHSIVPPVRGWRAAGCVADGESRVVASRTRSEGPPERRASKLARGSRSEPATH